MLQCSGLSWSYTSDVRVLPVCKRRDSVIHLSKGQSGALSSLLMCREPRRLGVLSNFGLWRIPDLKHCFELYLDYLLNCIVDPTFCKHFGGHVESYTYAIHKIEADSLETWR